MRGRYVQVSRPGGPLEIVERDVPEPDAWQVRIKVQACGICHGDSITLRVLRHAGSYSCVHELQYD